MKKTTAGLILFFGFLFFSLGVSAQQQKQATGQNEQGKFYRRSLQLDSAKAEQVAKIQAEYKKNLNLVSSDTSLTETGKRAKIELLMQDKNRQLRSILSKSQQQKVIPPTEIGGTAVKQR